MPTAPDLFGLCAKVPLHRVQRSLERLREIGAVDPNRALRSRDDHLLVPLSDPERAREAGCGEIVEAPLAPSSTRPPIDRIRERLRGRVPDRLLGALPEGWSRLGGVLLLRLPEPLEPDGRTVGRAYACTLGCDSVLRIERAEGELREPETRLLFGDEDTETLHREDGLVYHLDPSEVLFSPGNHHERHRLTDAIEPGEHVVDLFAGIGYFTLPLARAGARVTACELNPTASDYLTRNAEANDLAHRIEVREGDCRDLAPDGVADRVLMGYFPGTERFLPTALEALAPEGGWIHYHTVADEPDPGRKAAREVLEHPATSVDELSIRTTRRVKSVAPRRVHVALDMEVSP